MRLGFWIWCAWLACWGMSASATETDCQTAREMARAERTALQAGQVLDQAEVGVPDVSASAWRQENTQMR